ncbi:MAG: GIY-YIG nuclease family protein [Planctomycetes bacterium]|nr:GIY-YIG nuclease family protein [Planctomycetota bacterium]
MRASKRGAAARRAWIVYVLVSKVSGRTYVGIALDAKTRLAQHNGKQPGGAKSTRAHRPWGIAKRYGPFDTRGEAQHVEHAVKRLRGRARLRFAPDA